ncbi:MAG TPA: ADOP family duplicated permease [Candidatus Acidoferrales bacterium]|nr:ADOP family duplicated permease [Candidatus Acidoferrales bacterium]
MSLWSRIANVFRSEHLGREIEEEIQSHIEEAIRQGRDPLEARRALGSSLRFHEQSRELRLIPWLDSLRADAVFGWRQLMKNMLTSAAAVLSLALAIGACTASFRIVDALLLRPLPVANPERLYSVAYESPSATDGALLTYDSCSYPMFQRMRAAVRDRAELIAVSMYSGPIDLTYGADSDMEKANLQYVSGWMFSTFGLRPALGRLLGEPDDRAPGASPYAVISYDYWSRRFAKNPSIVGRTFRFGSDLYQIVGVAEERFTGTETGWVTDVFVPMAMKNPRTLASLNNFWLRALVQLKPGVAVEPLRDNLRAVFRAIEEERVKGFPTQSARDRERMFQERLLLEPAAAGRSNLQRDYRQALVSLAILVALVLLIACANVANLMTARAAARAREMALRVSIGAGRTRLIQLVLCESAWIAFLATAAGAAFAWWAAPFIVGRINFGDHPVRLILPADWRVARFGFAMASATTLLFGLTPALRASAVKPAGALRGGEDPHLRRRLMHALIVLQVAFCFVVHFAACLFTGTFERLTNQPTGFSAGRVLNLETVTSSPQAPVFWDQVAEHLRGVPGVEKVALIGWPLMSGESAVGNISIDGASPGEVFSDFVSVSPGWADVMRIPLLGGRDFRPDDANPRVAIVNQAFAKQYFDGRNPVGKFFERVEPAGGRARFEIVGFIRDARSRDRLRLPIRPTAYIPFPTVDANGELRPIGRGTFVVRTAGAHPLELAPALRMEVPRSRSGFRVTNIRAQAQINQAAAVRERLLAMLGLFFAFVALVLAGIGLYGVLDYSVLQRRREIGIRMAIGARAGDIVVRLTSDALKMVLAGAAAGLVLGLASARYVQALLYQVRPGDAATIALPAILIVAASLLAALPAVIRAVRIDPAAMLRSE